MNVSIIDLDRLKGFWERDGGYRDPVRKEEMDKELANVNSESIKKVAKNIIDSYLYTSSNKNKIDRIENNIKVLIDENIANVSSRENINDVAYFLYDCFKKQKIDETFKELHRIYSGIPSDLESKLFTELNDHIIMTHGLRLEEFTENALKEKIPARMITPLKINFTA
jgi:archaellum component FlaC